MAKVDVVLVDKNDKVVGLKEKYAAHQHPVPLHRAISIVIFDLQKKKMLIQQRAKDKPTWPLFWSNAVCTHPLPDESYQKAAQRRLEEELGFKVPLKEVTRFTYQAKYDETWGEHEYDVVFVGQYAGKVKANPKEVANYKWVEVEELCQDIKVNPSQYTPWFKVILKKVI